MDASKITELRQKQANTFINRAQVIDSSTLTWQRQIQSSRYLPQVNSNNTSQIPMANLGGCQTCGSFATTTVATDTQIRYPNPYFSSKGSGGQIISCDAITYKVAGDQSCGAQPQTPYVELPRCFCNNLDDWIDPNTGQQTNPEASQNRLNPYLPLPQPYIQLTQPQCTACGLYKVSAVQNGNKITVYNPPSNAPDGANIQYIYSPGFVMPNCQNQILSPCPPVPTPPVPTPPPTLPPPPYSSPSPSWLI